MTSKIEVCRRHTALKGLQCRIFITLTFIEPPAKPASPKPFFAKHLIVVGREEEKNSYIFVFIGFAGGWLGLAYFVIQIMRLTHHGEKCNTLYSFVCRYLMQEKCSQTIH